MDHSGEVLLMCGLSGAVLHKHIWSIAGATLQLLFHFGGHVHIKRIVT